MERDFKKNSVTVIMPTYNHDRYIGQALTSVMNQKFSGELRVLVFDDCSTDDTVLIVKDFIKNYPDNIFLYENPRNLGRAVASLLLHRVPIDTEFWCFLEGDDYWVSDTSLASRVRVLAENSNFVGCGGITRLVKVSGEEELISTKFKKFNLADYAYYFQRESFYLHTSSFIWRNVHSYDNLPFPAEFINLRGDPGLVLLMMGSTYSVGVLDSIVSVYNYTGLGIWSSLSAIEQARHNKLYMEKLKKVFPMRYKLLYYLSASMFSSDLTRKFANFLIKINLLPRPHN